jgi:hypothetical protein
VIQPVLPLYDCVADPVAVESIVEPLHSVADPAAASAAPTETSYLCVRV